MTVAPATRFVRPAGLSATEPAEARGLRRDGVRLLVTGHAGTAHARFRDLGRFLEPGDLLVVNTSATVPAAIDGRTDDGRAVVVHVAGQLDDGAWVVELRSPGAAKHPVLDARVGELVSLSAGAAVTLLSRYGSPPVGETHGETHGEPYGTRLWRAAIVVKGGRVRELLARAGRPISYGYLRGRWPLSAYQTVFATEPGSAEMPSAGRPFSTQLVTALVSSGVGFAPIVLHAGVSSLERGEAPPPERFRVPAATARAVEATRRGGGRVVAVGTTVVRALESAVRWGTGGRPAITAASGWTDLVLGPDQPSTVVDGLVTGLHEPEASHLLLLEAVAGSMLVQQAYDEAVARRYLWHEFGDSCLLLP
jgi:S-adenosylmethionine:tRNA ribosyltransferase-isomerase